MADEPEIAAEEGPQHEGPDPRHWPADETIGGLAEDLRAVQDILALMGKGDPRLSGPHYKHAGLFLQSLEAQLRETLAVALLDAYGIELPEEPEDGRPEGARPDIAVMPAPDPSAPFGNAGKARALGATSGRDQLENPPL